MRWAKILILFLILLATGCNQLEKASDIITGLSEKEGYKKDNKISDELYAIWKSRIKTALNDSLQIDLPYTETGILQPRNFAIYSYETYLMPGEVLSSSIETDTSNNLVFIEFYKRTKDSIPSFKKIKATESNQKSLEFEVQESGLYKVVVQPEIEAHSPFHILIQKKPVYNFPVLGGSNSSIGSYWDDIRDGGKRSHKGVDIFAERGTPAIAATAGRVGFTGEKGLGGKQVWLKDAKRRQSLYYAHLDSIKPNLGKVEPGDTLGFVGNTGNAKTTPPHLHFGIYKMRQGAINPLGYIYKTEWIEKKPILPGKMVSNVFINAKQANLRSKPAVQNSKILYKLEEGDTLSVQGKTADWYHVRNKTDKAAFIQENLVSPVN